jgi:hypothetical protein
MRVLFSTLSCGFRQPENIVELGGLGRLGHRQQTDFRGHRAHAIAPRWPEAARSRADRYPELVVGLDDRITV